MEELYKQILAGLEDDPSRPGLEKTPARAAAALKDLTVGYGLDPDELLRPAVFESESSGLVVCRDIHFVSVCEHHLLPFVGQATIAYWPRGKLVGISKLVRVTEALARRLQVQERLGQEILDSMVRVMEPDGCMVFMKALHLCMVARGVKQENATMETLAVTGSFANRPEEAWALLGDTS